MYEPDELSFAERYFRRYKSLPQFFASKPDEAVSIIVIIPCYDDEHIFRTLASVNESVVCYSESLATSETLAFFEVIVNVNSGENAPPEVALRNRAIFDKLQQQADVGYYRCFRLLPMLNENIVRKKAGVGYARRTAMDEAVRRFAAIGKRDGLIVSLDADTLVAPNYFQTIMRYMQQSDAQCFTFGFGHDFDPQRYSEAEIHACRLYEAYLRYYRLALQTFNSPFAIHTIGSCFAVRAEAYIKLGGMPPRQGGEDFYFLQKAVKMSPVCEVEEIIVFPSPRISDRVPFGTGPSVRKIIEQGDYKVYNFKLFGILKKFYELFPALYTSSAEQPVPQEIIDFYGAEAIESVIDECRHYSSSEAAFIKRMYNHFDAFFIVKFLNSFNDSAAYPPVSINAAATELFHYYGISANAE